MPYPLEFLKLIIGWGVCTKSTGVTIKVACFRRVCNIQRILWDGGGYANHTVRTDSHGSAIVATSLQMDLTNSCCIPEDNIICSRTSAILVGTICKRDFTTATNIVCHCKWYIRVVISIHTVRRVWSAKTNKAIERVIVLNDHRDTCCVCIYDWLYTVCSSGRCGVQPKRVVWWCGVCYSCSEHREGAYNPCPKWARIYRLMTDSGSKAFPASTAPEV